MNATPVPLRYYIYYRVRADIDPVDARATIRAMQAVIARRSGIAGRLLERVNDERTWMEVYEGDGVAEAFETALKEEAEAHQVVVLVEEGTVRHLERFHECV